MPASGNSGRAPLVGSAANLSLKTLGSLEHWEMVGRHICFGDGEVASPAFHLDGVTGNAKTEHEPKSIRRVGLRTGNFLTKN